MSMLWFLMLVAAAANLASGYNITMPGCNQTCPNSKVLIPYPFGIGDNCYHHHSDYYEVVCKPSSSSRGAPFKPFLKKNSTEVLMVAFSFDSYQNYYPDPANASANIYPGIGVGFGVNKLVVASDVQEICAGGEDKYIANDLRQSPFWYSTDNQVEVEGCPGHVNIKSSSGDVISGCSTLCKDDAEKSGGVNDEYGVGGCLVNLNQDVNYYEIGLSNYSGAQNDGNTCMKVTMKSYLPGRHSAVLNWNGPPISSVGSDDDAYSCSNVSSDISYCICNSGYQGNPYLPHGCQEVVSGQRGITNNVTKKKPLITGLGISLGSTTFLICSYGLFHVIRRWIRIKRKAKCFKRNGGLLLHQQDTTKDGKVARTKVFTVDELDKATDGFNGNRILGRGGQGTVYKGMLIDGRVVAIKKSLKVDESQIDQFINEVVILSQISHRNVVKLLGCCLETEVPLLVYEFIQNGTLGEHIHSHSEDSHITWKMRLQIAIESAGAIAYLHSASTTPIFHRDIKSSNILLDEKYRAKVADFGTSRTLLIDQTHLTTLVQGTLGYLDPEYFQTHQFTEKSDVYSFGVVLVELLTGQKPLSPLHSGGWRSLAMDFLMHMETTRLFEIVDSQILDEAKEDELLAMASIARRCLNLNGRQRPTMKEVSNVLEGIRSSTLPPDDVYHVEFNEYDEITELGETPEGHAATTAFCSENNVIDASISIESTPLMHYTI